MAETITAVELSKTINAVMANLNNFFVLPNQRITGNFKLENGSIILPLKLKQNQRIYIEPSGEHMEATGSFRIASVLPLTDPPQENPPTNGNGRNGDYYGIPATPRLTEM